MKNPKTEGTGENITVGQAAGSHGDSWLCRPEHRAEAALPPVEEKEKSKVDCAPGHFSATNSLSDSLSDSGQVSGPYTFLHLKNLGRAAMKTQDFHNLYVNQKPTHGE